METSTPPLQPTDLATPQYYQLVHTLNPHQPPPHDGTPAALRARNLAAIAKVAALLPVDANEADLAAQCIAARAQAEDILRLLRQHAGDIQLTMRLNAQYSSMVRTSLSAHARLMRVQALRHKRAAIDAAATQDAWTLHIAERSMLNVVDPHATPQQAPSPEPPPPPAATPVEAPPAHGTQTTPENVSHAATKSHNTAFETPMSTTPWNALSRGPAKPDPREIGLGFLARSLLAGQERHPTSHQSPARAA